MFNKIKDFFKSQRGINTVEVVILLAIMVGIAILFKNQISKFVTTLLNKSLKTNQFWANYNKRTMDESFISSSFMLSEK